MGSSIELSIPGQDAYADSPYRTHVLSHIKCLPHSETIPFKYLIDPLPVGDHATLLASHRTDTARRVLWSDRGYIVHARSFPSVNETYFDFYAPTIEELARLVADWTERIPGPPATIAEVTTNLWYMGSGGSAAMTARYLSMSPWSDIERNYPERVRSSITNFLPTNPRDQSSGRLMLWHGAPGTGKTNAIRALARAWSDRATIHVVTDPETFFASAGYMLSVVTSTSARSKDGQPKAFLVILEDTDELIRADSSHRGGLSKLLNFTDGIAAQGFGVNYLLTTNEDVVRLNPALTRPGRCRSLVEFGPLTAAESSEWLGYPVAAPMSLAALYAARGETSQEVSLSPSAPNPSGGYI